jgi:hypothetical protein
MTFGTMKVVDLQPYAESTPGHMVPSVASKKIPSDNAGDRFRDPPTSSAVP